MAEEVRKGPQRLPPNRGVSPGSKIVIAVSDADTLDRLAVLLERDIVTRYVENRIVTPVMTGAFATAQGFVEVHGPGVMARSTPKSAPSPVPTVPCIP